jgi:hypothetical protein
MSALRAMLRGTMLFIRARREASPTERQHVCLVSLAHANVAGNEFAGVFKLGQGLYGVQSGGHRHGAGVLKGVKRA